MPESRISIGVQVDDSQLDKLRASAESAERAFIKFSGSVGDARDEFEGLNKDVEAFNRRVDEVKDMPGIDADTRKDLVDMEQTIIGKTRTGQKMVGLEYKAYELEEKHQLEEAERAKKELLRQLGTTEDEGDLLQAHTRIGMIDKEIEERKRRLSEGQYERQSYDIGAELRVARTQQKGGQIPGEEEIPGVGTGEEGQIDVPGAGPGQPGQKDVPEVGPGADMGRIAASAEALEKAYSQLADTIEHIERAMSESKATMQEYQAKLDEIENGKKVPRKEMEGIERELRLRQEALRKQERDLMRHMEFYEIMESRRLDIINQTIAEEQRLRGEGLVNRVDSDKRLADLEAQRQAETRRLSTTRSKVREVRHYMGEESDAAGDARDKAQGDTSNKGKGLSLGGFSLPSGGSLVKTGLSILGISSIAGIISDQVGKVMQGMSEYTRHTLALTELGHKVKTVEQDYTSWQQTILETSKGLGYTNDQVIQLVDSYSALAGKLSTGELQSDLREIQEFSRGYGFDPAFMGSAVGAMRRAGVVGSGEPADAGRTITQMTPQEFMLLLGASFEASGMQGREQELVQVLNSLVEGTSQTSVLPPDPVQMMGILAQLGSTGVQGLMGQRGGEILGSVSQGIMQPGAGEAGEYFTMLALNKGRDLDYFQLKSLQELGAFGTAGQLQERGVIEGAVDSPDATNLQMIMESLKNHNADRNVRAEAASQLLPISRAQYRALEEAFFDDKGQFKTKELQDAASYAGTLGIDAQNIPLEGLRYLTQFADLAKREDEGDDTAKAEAFTLAESIKKEVVGADFGEGFKIGDLAGKSISEITNVVMNAIRNAKTPAENLNEVMVDMSRQYEEMAGKIVGVQEGLAWLQGTIMGGVNEALDSFQKALNGATSALEKDDKAPLEQATAIQRWGLGDSQSQLAALVASQASQTFDVDQREDARNSLEAILLNYVRKYPETTEGQLYDYVAMVILQQGQSAGRLERYKENPEAVNEQARDWNEAVAKNGGDGGKAVQSLGGTAGDAQDWVEQRKKIDGDLRSGKVEKLIQENAPLVETSPIVNQPWYPGVMDRLRGIGQNELYSEEDLRALSLEKMAGSDLSVAETFEMQGGRELTPGQFSAGNIGKQKDLGQRVTQWFTNLGTVVSNIFGETPDIYEGTGYTREQLARASSGISLSADELAGAMQYAKSIDEAYGYDIRSREDPKDERYREFISLYKEANPAVGEIQAKNAAQAVVGPAGMSLFQAWKIDPTIPLRQEEVDSWKKTEKPLDLFTKRLDENLPKDEQQRAQLTVQDIIMASAGKKDPGIAQMVLESYERYKKDQYKGLPKQEQKTPVVPQTTQSGALKDQANDLLGKEAQNLIGRPSLKLASGGMTIGEVDATIGERGRELILPLENQQTKHMLQGVLRSAMPEDLPEQKTPVVPQTTQSGALKDQANDLLGKEAQNLIGRPSLKLASGGMTIGEVDATIGERGRELILPLENQQTKHMLQGVLRSAMPEDLPERADYSFLGESAGKAATRNGPASYASHKVEFGPVEMRLRYPDGKEEKVTVLPKQKTLQLGNPFAGVNYQGA